MTKKALIESVYNVARAQNVNVSKKLAGVLVEDVFATIEKQLQETGRFSYSGWGSWRVR